MLWIDLGGLIPCRIHKQLAKCPKCSRMFSEDELNLHIADEHFNLSDIACPICSVHVGTRRNLIPHLDQHHTYSYNEIVIPQGVHKHLEARKGMVCPICNCRKKKSELAEHINWEHKDVPASLIYKRCKSLAIHICSICSKVFSNKCDLSDHLRDIHKFKKFKDCVPCPKCDKMLYKKNLKKHMNKLHYDHETNSACPICHLVIKRAKLTDHINNDHKGLPLTEMLKYPWLIEVCHICSKVFRYNYLKGHLEIKHNIKEETVKLVCQICSQDFRAKPKLELHMERHLQRTSKIKEKEVDDHIETDYVDIACPICGCERTKPKLVEHINTDHKDLSPSVIYSKCSGVVEACRKCSKVFTYKRSLRNHMEDVHNYGICVICTKCGKILPKKNLQKHIAKVHEELELNITCPICNIGTKKPKLANHINTEHKTVPLDELVAKCEPMMNVCRKCSSVFKNIERLNCHIRQVHGKNERKAAQCVCLICSKELKDKHKLKRHMQNEHEGIKKDPKKRVNPKERILCSVCGLTFANSLCLRPHMRIHTGDKPYDCKICGQSFRQTSILAKHMYQHAEVRPPPKFICTHCGKGFLYSSHYKSHIVVHTDEKPYSCTICGARFKSKRVLKGHNDVHTNLRPYVCAICTKPFARKQHLTVHMRGHTGTRPYSCPTCGKAFMQNCVLKSHMNTAHSVPADSY